MITKLLQKRKLDNKDQDQLISKNPRVHVVDRTMSSIVEEFLLGQLGSPQFFPGFVAGLVSLASMGDDSVTSPGFRVGSVLPEDVPAAIQVTHLGDLINPFELPIKNLIKGVSVVA